MIVNLESLTPVELLFAGLLLGDELGVANVQASKGFCAFTNDEGLSLFVDLQSNELEIRDYYGLKDYFAACGILQFVRQPLKHCQDELTLGGGEQ